MGIYCAQFWPGKKITEQNQITKGLPLGQWDVPQTYIARCVDPGYDLGLASRLYLQRESACFQAIKQKVASVVCGRGGAAIDAYGEVNVCVFWNNVDCPD